MTEKKKPITSYFAFYPSYYETITEFVDSEHQLEALKAFLEYGLYGMEPSNELPDMIRALFAMARPTIDKHIRDIENGKKGGRPRKDADAETGDKTPVKTPGNTKKEKEKERDMEREKDISFPFPYKESKNAAAPAPNGGDRVSDPFTFADVLDTIKEHDIELTEAEARGFYEWMQKYNWTINGNRVSKLENALKGYSKKHHKEPDELADSESQEEKARKKQENARRSEEFDAAIQNRPDYVTPSKEVPEELRKLMIRDRISEWDLRHVVGLKLTAIGYSTEKPVCEYEQEAIKTILSVWAPIRNLLEITGNN